MKTTITFDNVSKEVRTKISKIGKDQLVKKFQDGKFTTLEEVVAASHYIAKRESMTQREIDKIEATLYVDLFFPTPTALTKEEEDAAAKNNQGLKDLKDYSEQEAALGKKSSKKIETPIIKLTAQEFPLFKKIEKVYKKNKDVTIKYNAIDKGYESYREFKGVLGSLMKKGIVTYTKETITILELGLDMIEGRMQYKQKAKNEQNYFRNQRLVVEVKGKKFEKSAYVRSQLKKNPHLTCNELNIMLSELGYGKLYHSELQRCKNQLGIVTVKDED